MKPSTDLFLLIHSLTKPEKGYFKKFAARHKKDDNNYLKLFDAINSQKIYDEPAIIKKFAKEGFVKQIRFYKNYLYTLILKSLVSYNADNTASGRIFSLIRMAEALKAKGLIGKAKKIVLEAKELAIKYDKLFYLEEITILELEVNGKAEVQDMRAVTKLRSVYKEQVETLDKARKQIVDRYTWNSIYLLNCFNGNIPDKEKISEAEAIKIINDLEKEENGKYSTFESKRILYYLCGLFYSTVGWGKGKSNDNLKKLIDLFDSNPHHIKERPRYYTDQLINYMYSSLFEGDVKEFKKTRDKLLNLQVIMPEVRNDFNTLKIDSITVHNNLYYYYISCQFEKVTDVIIEISKKNLLEKIGSASYPLYGKYFYIFRIQILFFIGCLLFYSNDFKKALKWFTLIWNDKDDKDLHQEVYHAVILSILCHYETGNYDSMKYMIQNITNSVNRLDRFADFEQVFCKSMIQLTNCRSNSEKLAVFKKMKPALEPYQSMFTEFATFDMLRWIESKIEGVPAAKLIRERVKVPA